MRRSVARVVLPDLSQPLFDSIFFVHLAALSKEEGEERLHSGVVRDDLLDFALEREARYWSATARASRLELDDEVVRRAVALATLTTADSEKQAAATLAAVLDLADANQDLLRRTARWLRELYPTGSPQSESDERERARAWFRRLAPDLLGEALVANVLDDVPELAGRLLASATAPQTKRAHTVLAQAARNHVGAENALRTALTHPLPSLWATAIAVAQETGAMTLGHVLDDVRGAGMTIEVSGVPPQARGLLERYGARREELR
jgi:hypothetical protein